MTTTVRPGYATDTTCKIGVWSTTAGSVTLSVGGYTDTQSLIGFPSGNPVVYYYHFTATGLNEFVQYDFTVTHSADDNASGKCYTAPSETDDFAFHFYSCDNPGNHQAHISGFHEHIHDYALNGDLPLVGIMAVDDLGYVDAMNVDDSEADGTGVANPDGVAPPSCTAGDNRKQAYAIAYMCAWGMLTGTTNNLNLKAFGNDLHRHWNQENINIWPQWGDHEFTNDLGFEGTTLDAGANQSLYNDAKAAWDVFYGGIQPPTFSAYSNGWGFELGAAYLSALDNITNGQGTTFVNGGTDLTQYLGITAITDYLSAVEAAQKAFNINGMQFGIRYLDNEANVTSKSDNGAAQHALYNHQRTEYQRLFTQELQDPPSLMDNDYTNGALGIWLGLHGDWHRAKVEHHEAAAYTSNLAENFYDITMGTNNGSFNFGMNAAIKTAYDAGDPMPPTASGDQVAQTTTMEYLGKDWETTTSAIDATNDIYPEFWGLRIEVYGSRYPKEMHVILLGANTQADSVLDAENNKTNVDPLDWNAANYAQRDTKTPNHTSILWRKKFVQVRGGNNAHNVEENLSSKIGVIGG
jgi:hypothetical protein